MIPRLVFQLLCFGQMSSIVVIPAVGTKLFTTAVKAVVIMIEGRNLSISKIPEAC